MATELDIRNRIGGSAKDTNSANLKGSQASIPSFLARVTFVLLDDSDQEKFIKYGGWKGIGTIECIPFMTNNSAEDVISATPVSPNFNIFPVINEVVQITYGISKNAQGVGEDQDLEYFYTNTVSVWNSPEHNAIPNNTWKKAGYESITGVFRETGKVKRIIKGPGDISIEGRSGNLLRMGSSIQGFNGPFIGNDRSPLLTIVNGQREVVDNQVAIYEDINLDGSSIYMLHGHNVNFSVSSLNFDSYNVVIEKQDTTQTPTAIENYVVPVVEKKPDTEIQKVVDTLPTVKPIINQVNPKAPSTVSNTAGDDIGLEEPSIPVEYFSLEEIEEFVNLNECSETSEKEENDLPSSESSAPIILTYSSNPVAKSIKWQKQKTPTWCYVASLSMLLQSYGISNASQENIDEKYVIKSGKEKGNLNNIKLAKELGLYYVRQNLPDGKRNSYDSILRTIKARGGKPFILQRKGLSRPNHFVLVVGYSSDGRISIYDPASDKNKYGIYLELDNLKESGNTIRIFDLPNK